MSHRQTEHEPFDRLLARARTGEEAALGELFDRYGRLVRLAVRRSLPDRLRSEYDSLDFVQDVWASFLALGPERMAFPTPAALAGFLARMTRNKLVDAVRHRAATDRRLDPARPDPDGVPTGLNETPSQWAVAGERWDALVARLPEGQRALLEQLRAGRTHPEIAADLGIPLRTLGRIVRRLKDLCEG